MNAMTELTLDDCLELLRTHEAGRIALTTPAGLRIFPVNYALHGDAVVFRTLPYGEIANNAQDAEVAFQIDHLDPVTRHGWSVLAVGKAHRVTDPDEVRAIREGGDPTPWADGQRILYFRLDWTTLTGRQLGRSGATVMPTARPGL